MGELVYLKQIPKEEIIIRQDNDIVSKVSHMILDHMSETSTLPELDSQRKRYIFEEIVNCINNKY